jgi:hypothetical protein
MARLSLNNEKRNRNVERPVYENITKERLKAKANKKTLWLLKLFQSLLTFPVL